MSKIERELIQGLWIGDSLSLMEQLSIASFLKNGHEYHLYAYEELKNVPDGSILKNAEEIVPRSGLFIDKRIGQSFANFSDLFRYKLLFEKGGFWADLDTICLKPFDFSSEYVFASQFIQAGEITGKGPIFDFSSQKFITLDSAEDETQKLSLWHACGGIMKAPAGCEVMSYCYERSMERESKPREWWDLGPPLVSEAVHRFGLSDFVVSPQTFCPVDWWDWQSLMNDKFQFGVLLEGSHAVHLWNSVWGINSHDKDAKYPSFSLYEHLKRVYLDSE